MGKDKAAAAAQVKLTESFGIPIKQYAGQLTRARREGQGAWEALQRPDGRRGGSRLLGHWVVASEFKEQHDFERHAKAWGAVHRGPGIR